MKKQVIKRCMVCKKPFIAREDRKRTKRRRITCSRVCSIIYSRIATRVRLKILSEQNEKRKN